MKSYEIEIQYYAAFENLSLNSWSKMNLQQRKQTLQQVENFAAMHENRPAASFQLDNTMKPERRGYYNTDKNLIVQNIRLIEENKPDAAVKNLLHEGRHAYQYDCIMHPERHTEIKPEKIAEWREGFQSYVSTDVNKDFHAYFVQAVEKDARKFARQNCNSYLNGNVFRETVKKLEKKENTHMWGKSKKQSASQEKSSQKIKSAQQSESPFLKQKREFQEKSSQKMKSAQQSESPFLKQRREFTESLRLSPEYQKKQEAVLKNIILIIKIIIIQMEVIMATKRVAVSEQMIVVANVVDIPDNRRDING